ncbi:hypothetical protein T265_01469 [Opisthorchis viverrini]|uniref:Uncharacterized protein n=1 Tax=Opisthorchis viverrini TaxID=6198 RepID=A0A075A9I7_OPIVI|nr:hypothetical protein T265_01469 [Opisthorchis viverrini]KER32410.1 hypothetical protein T265_01469 [Opisthorchis viverrini]
MISRLVFATDLQTWIMFKGITELEPASCLSMDFVGGVAMNPSSNDMGCYMHPTGCSHIILAATTEEHYIGTSVDSCIT